MYNNKTARFNVDVGDFSIVGKFTEYEYDYDNCFNYDWEQSNDCETKKVRNIILL